MHYYKRNLGDYAKKTGRLSMLEHGAYTLLIDSCYDRERFPTMAEAVSWCWARSADEIAAVEFVLERFFTKEGDLYVQTRIQEEIAKYHQNAQINSRIATEREAKRTKRVTTVNASTTVEHEPPPNQEPLTINHMEAKASLSPAKLPPCPVDDVISLYHDTLPELPCVRLLPDKRRKAISTFWKWTLTSKRSDGSSRACGAAGGLSWIKSYFERARENDFLMGRLTQAGSHANWQCDLDFLLTENGKKHVIEKTRE